jgi:hypothetical protein
MCRFVIHDSKVWLLPKSAKQTLSSARNSAELAGNLRKLSSILGLPIQVKYLKDPAISTMRSVIGFVGELAVSM